MNKPRQRLEWALGRCSEIQLRMTGCRRAILEVLAESSLPVTLEMISRSVGGGERFDPATVFRNLTLLKEADVVRSVGTISKSGYYLLNVPGEHCHFLICRRCGSIKASPCGHHFVEMEEDLERDEGYREIYHELTFYGICPACQNAAGAPPTVKLPVPNQVSSP